MRSATDFGAGNLSMAEYLSTRKMDGTIPGSNRGFCNDLEREMYPVVDTTASRWTEEKCWHRPTAQKKLQDSCKLLQEIYGARFEEELVRRMQLMWQAQRSTTVPTGQSWPGEDWSAEGWQGKHRPHRPTAGRIGQPEQFADAETEDGYQKATKWQTRPRGEADVPGTRGNPWFEDPQGQTPLQKTSRRWRQETPPDYSEYEQLAARPNSSENQEPGGQGVDSSWTLQSCPAKQLCCPRAESSTEKAGEQSVDHSQTLGGRGEVPQQPEASVGEWQAGRLQQQATEPGTYFEAQGTSLQSAPGSWESQEYWQTMPVLELDQIRELSQYFDLHAAEGLDPEQVKAIRQGLQELQELSQKLLRLRQARRDRENQVVWQFENLADWEADSESEAEGHPKEMHLASSRAQHSTEEKAGLPQSCGDLWPAQGEALKPVDYNSDDEDSEDEDWDEEGARPVVRIPSGESAFTQEAMKDWQDWPRIPLSEIFVPGQLRWQAKQRKK